MTGMTPAPRPGPGPVPPAPEAAAGISQVLAEYPSWSVFWDQHAGVWRAAEDDPDSGLYTASSDPGTVAAYIRAHS
jgi:hypothetical protein